MKRQKTLLVIILLVCLVGVVNVGKLNQPGRQAGPADKRGEEVELKEEGVELVIDYGDERVSTFSGLPARRGDGKTAGAEEATVYDLLELVTAREKLVLETEAYDFGKLIKAIGDKENTREFAWIYFVNGKSGEVAADRQVVKGGDLVEWKYLQPNF